MPAAEVIGNPYDDDNFKLLPNITRDRDLIFVGRLVSDKGFGFIMADSGQEYFFHQSACASFASLREGQAVTFQTGQGPKGPRAENVREA